MNRTACLAALAVILAHGPSPAVAFGGFAGQPEEAPIERTVRLEMEGGQKLEGKVYFQPLIVESELGRYTIRPDRIRTIQFLRRANLEEPPAPAAEDPRPAKPNAMMGGMMRPTPPNETVVRGKVVTTSDKVIIGDIHIPGDFALELEFGRLTPAPDKLRMLTMIDGEAPAARPAAPRDGPAPNSTAGRPGVARKGRD